MKWDPDSLNPSKIPEYIIAMSLRFMKSRDLSEGSVKQLPVDMFTCLRCVVLKCLVLARECANESESPPEKKRSHKGKSADGQDEVKEPPGI